MSEPKPKRTVTVRCEWRTTHEVEIDADIPPLASDDITTVLAFDEISAGGAELHNWEVVDNV